MASADVILLYWYWILFGVALVIAEIFLSSFTVLWFGLGAVLVGILLWLMPGMSTAVQLLLWLLLSCGLALFWFRYFKPRMVDKTKAGIAREAAIGEAGMVIRAPAEGGRGRVRFTTPILGDDEWEFICEQPVQVGDRVHIREFSGNALIVIKL
ncbi:MAG: NfeD family protein [Porticoccaceae bacterium]|jgi:membrane protein implicated in regulation of membrane protease activity